MSDDFANVSADIPGGWRPSEGDKIVGKVKDLILGYSDYTQDNYPIVVVHDEETDRDVSIHCFHFVLNKKMQELEPRVGERIAVIHGGTKPSKDGRRSITLYQVKVEGRSANVWRQAAKPSNTPSPTEQAELESDQEAPF